MEINRTIVQVARGRPGTPCEQGPARELWRATDRTRSQGAGPQGPDDPSDQGWGEEHP